MRPLTGMLVTCSLTCIAAVAAAQYYSGAYSYSSYNQTSRMGDVMRGAG